jgi:hypothetical protein
MFVLRNEVSKSFYRLPRYILEKEEEEEDLRP